MTPYERDIICRREAYIMAKRSPWHLWAAQALRAGYIPPLVPGTIPPDIPRLLPVGGAFGSLEPQSPLANMPRSDRGDSRMAAFGKGVLGFIVSLVIFVSISLMVYSVKTGADFHVALLSRYAH
ncbi:MAG: hypothetical protein ABIH23_27935 [bacterium]